MSKYFELILLSVTLMVLYTVTNGQKESESLKKIAEVLEKGEETVQVVLNKADVEILKQVLEGGAQKAKEKILGQNSEEKTPGKDSNKNENKEGKSEKKEGKNEDKEGKNENKTTEGDQPTEEKEEEVGMFASFKNAASNVLDAFVELEAEEEESSEILSDLAAEKLSTWYFQAQEKQTRLEQEERGKQLANDARKAILEENSGQDGFKRGWETVKDIGRKGMEIVNTGLDKLNAMEEGQTEPVAQTIEATPEQLSQLPPMQNGNNQNPPPSSNDIQL